jgi:hypothetical protein
MGERPVQLPWENRRDGEEEQPIEPAEQAENPNAPEFDLEAHMARWKGATLEGDISVDHLYMISEASGGFRYEPDPKLAMQALQTGKMQTGYTNLVSKVIYFNPLLKLGAPELGLAPWRPIDARGFAYHEAGHHTPEVEKLQDVMLKNLNNPSIIPEGYRGDKDTEQRFLGALHSHLHNGLADVWLESYMGRRPYFGVKEDITDFQTAKGPMQDLTKLTKPEQLVQALLACRYREEPEIKKEVGRRKISRDRLQRQSLVRGKVDDDVFDAYCRLLDQGAMRVLMTTDAYENFFAADREREKAMERKVAAYKEAFLPEYLRMLQNELDERKKQKQGGGGGGKPGEGGSGGSQPSGSDAVPPTKEEQQQMIDEILKAIEKAGAELESMAPSEADQKKLEQQMNQIRQTLELRHKALEEGKQLPPMPMPQPENLAGEEALRQAAKELMRKQRELENQNLAEKHGVKPESIKKWERIKEQYRNEINSTASTLAEIFLDDRRKRLEYLRRSGEIIPGLEYETVTALLSGELDPDTKMEVVRNTEFLETEVEGIVDRSGSMSGDKLDLSVALFVILVEAFKKVREDLAAEDLISPLDDQPFRVGATAFETTPERITKLDEPLSEQKELLIVDRLSEAGGGTEETGAIKQVYAEMKLRKGNVIKFIVVLTDGQGSREAVAPIMHQIEQDDEVVFLVVGLGDDDASAQAIVDTYIRPLRDREKNIFAVAAPTPQMILPSVLDFLKREVGNRRSNF